MIDHPSNLHVVNADQGSIRNMPLLDTRRIASRQRQAYSALIIVRNNGRLTWPIDRSPSVTIRSKRTRAITVLRQAVFIPLSPTTRRNVRANKTTRVNWYTHAWNIRSSTQCAVLDMWSTSSSTDVHRICHLRYETDQCGEPSFAGTLLYGLGRASERTVSVPNRCPQRSNGRSERKSTT